MKRPVEALKNWQRESCALRLVKREILEYSMARPYNLDRWKISAGEFASIRICYRIGKTYTEFI